MKKFTFLTIALMAAVVTFAALLGKQSESPFNLLQRSEMIKVQQPTLKVKAQDRKAQPTRNAVKRAPAELVTPPEGATAETYYTAGGNFYVKAESGWANATDEMPSVNVVIDGSDMYMQGLAYWFETAWIKGTIEGTTVTFPSGQYIGTDEYGDEFIVGSEDGKTVADIVFEYDSEAGTLTATTPFIIENKFADEVSPYCYWYSPVFSKTEPEAPALVELPEGVEALPYLMTYTDDKDNAGSVPVKVAVDGNDVYVQGISTFLPEAWVKGVKDGNEVTFATMQYVGEYYSYGSSYAFYNGDAVFTFDAEAGTYTAEGVIYGVLADKYYDGYYVDPVLSPVVEKAAMPANPEITDLTNTNYGYVVEFNVPAVDINGDGLVTDKLSFTFYTDIEGEIAQMTFTPETHTRLTEALAEIPYRFTEDYDFYSTYIYLNNLYSEDWNNIGIQSIYRGGGEENATEIQWFHIKDYAKPAGGEFTFDFNKMDVPTSSNVTKDGDITEDMEISEGDVTLTITPKTTSSSTENRFWSTTAGPQLRVYSGTLTFEATEGLNITQIVFNHNGKWGANTVEGVEIPNDADAKVATWTGEAQTVVVTIAANSQINSIVVTVKGGEVPVDPNANVYDFEDGTLQGWTTIDADGDGYTWKLGAGPSINTVGESSYSVYSESYSSDAGALTPDNYLVSPQIKLDGSISFYACAQDGSWAAEHFAVAVSTNGNTDAADFTNVEEWTMTASRVANPSFAPGKFRGPRKAPGAWYKYTVDLSSYEGAEGYVAIRHFDCTDNFYIVVDDITLVSSHVTMPDFTIAPAEGVVESLSDFTIIFNNYDITVAEDAAATLTNTTTETTVNGTIGAEGNTLTISFDETTEGGEYTLTVAGISTAEGEPVELSFNYTIEAAPEAVVLPEGVETEEYTMFYEDEDGNSAAKAVYVAVDGTNIYIQGLSEYIPEAWVQGTMDGNTVTFPAMQLFGEYQDYESYAFYGEDDVIFTYDAESDTYTAEGEVYGVLGDRYYDGHYFNPVITKVVEKAVMPADPKILALEEDRNYGFYVDFNVPVVDVNGDYLVPAKLSYIIYADTDGGFAPLTFTPDTHSKLTEDITEIPYGFTEDYDFYNTRIYLNDLYSEDWTRIGIQSIYRGGDEENKTEIQWFDKPEVVEAVEAPEGLETESYLFKAVALEYGEEEADEDYSVQVEVGFDGDDVYIKGISTDNPEFCVKATKSEAGKYVIPANQYMGTMDVWGYFFYDYYFTAVDENGNFEDVVLSYDAETATFTSDQTLVLNGSNKELDPYYTYNNVTITKMEDLAATPADPILESYNFENGAGYNTIYAIIPTVDVDGNVLLTSKLFYTIWYEKDGVEQPYTFTLDLYYNDFDENITEIPYGYDGYDIYKGGEIIYLEDEPEELATWTKVGIQSIYYGGGECNKSNIVWYNPETTAISEVKTDSKNAVIFDLQGRRVAAPAKGLYIVNNKKVVVK